MQRLFSFALAVLFSLPAAAQITGTIIDHDGKPLAGVDVGAYAVESSADAAMRLRSESPERETLARASTDDDGQFALEIEEHDVVDLMFLADGYAPEGLSVGSSGEIGAHILRAAEMREGSVSYKGEPVAGAAVRWTDGNVEYLTFTNEEGGYRVPDPVVWKPSLEIHHASIPFYSWKRERFPAPYRSPELDVAISGSTVKGLVSGDEDSPVADAEVLVDGVELGRTDEQGHFEIEIDAKWKELVAISGGRIGSLRRGAKKQTVRLAPAAVIEGRILDARGRGVPRATVTLLNAVRGYRGGRSITLVTGTDGSYSSGPVPPGRYQATVQRPGYSLATSEVQSLSGETATEDHVLTLAATVEGAVRDEERTPMAGVTVAAENRSQALPSSGRRSGATGPDGRYVLLDVPGALKTRVWAMRAGLPYSKSDMVETQPGARLSGIDITITRGFEVTGRLVNEAGEPVAGAKVGATDNDFSIEMMFTEYPGSSPMDFPLTDDEGHFTTQLARGTWFIAFKAPGYVVTVTEGKKVDGPVSLGEIVMKPGGELSGKVVRESGVPVEEAGVAIREPELGFTMATTDSEGRFAFRDLPLRAVNVTVYKEDGSRASKRIEIPATDVVFELPEVVTLRGRVIDAETKSPLTDFMLGVSQSQPGGGGKVPYHSEDGTFEIEAVPSEGLALAASAAGYAETKKLVDVAEGSDPEPVELALPRGVRVFGAVSDSSGRPLAGVTVGYDKSVDMGRGGSMRMRESEVTTDANGSYSLDSVAAGSAQFGFTKQGYLRADRTIETTGRETRLDVELPSGVALRGIVVDESGMPVANARVFGSTSGESRSYASAETGADGRFVLEPLAPGKGRLSVSASGLATTSVEDVEIGSGPDVRVVMEEGAIVEGRVIGVDSSEMQNVILRITGEQSHERRVNSAGEFRIEELKAGTKTITASARLTSGYRSSKSVELELVAGQVSPVELEFVEGNTLRGIVTVGEKPLAGASIVFRPKDGQSGGVNAIADDDGRYEAAGLADGEYQVAVTEFHTRRWFETSYQMRGSGEFDIHFEDGRVEGRVVDASTGEPIDGATVTVEMGERRAVSFMTASAVADDDGRFVILASTTGEMTLVARSKGYGTAVRQVSSDGSVSGLEIEMQESAGLTLRASDARDGRALVPSVTIEDMSGRVLSTENFQSAPDGVVTLDLAPGRYRLLVWSRNYAWKAVSVTVPSDEVHVALTIGGKLALHAPVDKPHRVIVRDSSGHVVRRWPGETREMFIVKGSTTVHGLSAGEYSVEATAVSGGSTKVLEATVVDGETAEIELN